MTDLNTWNSSRSGRRGNDAKAANQQRQAAGSRDGTPNSQQSRRSGKSNPNMNKSVENISNGPVSLPQPPQDEHIPIIGFNLSEVDAMLKRGVESTAMSYKAETKISSAKTDGPWGTKPGSMASGKDFWLELRRQVTTLQQTGGISQGG